MNQAADLTMQSGVQLDLSFVCLGLSTLVRVLSERFPSRPPLADGPLSESILSGRYFQSVKSWSSFGV